MLTSVASSPHTAGARASAPHSAPPGCFMISSRAFCAASKAARWLRALRHPRTALTDAVAKRHQIAGASDPETWSTPVTGYGEPVGLRVPARQGIYQLPGGEP